MFEVDVRLCCDWLLKADVCYCFAVRDDACCLYLMLGYVVSGYVKFVCVLCLPFSLMIGA